MTFNKNVNFLIQKRDAFLDNRNTWYDIYLLYDGGTSKQLIESFTGVPENSSKNDIIEIAKNIII